MTTAKRRERPRAIGRVPKEYRALIVEAEAQGFRLERRRGGHFALIPPAGGGSPVFFSTSPTDGGRYTVRKIEADLKRRGFTPGRSEAARP